MCLKEHQKLRVVDVTVAWEIYMIQMVWESRYLGRFKSPSKLHKFLTPMRRISLTWNQEVMVSWHKKAFQQILTLSIQYPLPLILVFHLVYCFFFPSRVTCFLKVCRDLAYISQFFNVSSQISCDPFRAPSFFCDSFPEHLTFYIMAGYTVLQKSFSTLHL